MNPWDGNGRRPECPRCEQASFMYKVRLDEERWWCSECLTIWKMPEGVEVGGQQELPTFAPDRPEDGA